MTLDYAGCGLGAAGAVTDVVEGSGDLLAREGID